MPDGRLRRVSYDLIAVGVEKVCSEQVSSVDRRAKRAEALDYICEGDTLIVTKPDRLARLHVVTPIVLLQQRA